MSRKSEAVMRRRRKQAEYIRSIKSRPCEDCEIQYPYWVMQFDHVRGKKEFALSRVTCTNISRERIDAEIRKCDVVCANCHALRHPPEFFKQFGNAKKRNN